jgi:hypothetical protein
MLGHRTRTEEVVLQTRSTDEWAFYQAKNGRAAMYEADGGIAELSGAAGASVAATFRERAAKEKDGASSASMARCGGAG